MRLSLLRPLALAPLLGVVGPLSLGSACSVGVAGASGSSGSDSLVRDAAEGASSAALVVFERTVVADETARESAVARFLKMRSGFVDDETLRMVGASLDLPQVGTCAAAPGASTDLRSGDAFAAGARSGDGPHAVELLDVGALAVDVDGVHTALEARALPDITDLVTGVLYSTAPPRAASPDPSEAGAASPTSATSPTSGASASTTLPDRGRYVLRSTGSSLSFVDVDRLDGAERGVPPFVVAATAPGEPAELRIDGQDARASDGVVLTTGAHVDVIWAVPEGSDPDDEVYFELVPGPSRATGGGSRDGLSAEPSSLESARELQSADRRMANVRCVFADRGSASIPASAFLTEPSSAETPGATRGSQGLAAEMTRGTLLIHRIHQETFQVTGQVTGQVAGQPAGSTVAIGSPSMTAANERTGIESGIVRFDFARAVEFTRR